MAAVQLGLPKEALLQPLPKKVTALKTFVLLSGSPHLFPLLSPPPQSSRPMGLCPVESQLKLSPVLGSMILASGGFHVLLLLCWRLLLSQAPPCRYSMPHKSQVPQHPCNSFARTCQPHSGSRPPVAQRICSWKMGEDLATKLGKERRLWLW